MADLSEIFELTKYGDVKFEEFKKALPLDQIDLVDAYGRTPLMSSCYYLKNQPHIKTIQYLVDNGANLEVEDKSGLTALMLLCYFWNNTPSIESIKTIKFMVENGANIHKKDSYKENILKYLCFYPNNQIHVEIIKYFLDVGIKMNTVDIYGFSALDYAKQNNMPRDVMRMLRKYSIINHNRWSVGMDLFSVI